METFPANPLPSSYKISKAPRVLKADFGDQYSETIPDGIHHMILPDLELPWNNIEKWEAQAFDTFLSARKGTEAFFYTLAAHENIQRKFKCLKWETSYKEGTLVDFRATFTEQP